MKHAWILGLLTLSLLVAGCCCNPCPNPCCPPSDDDGDEVEIPLSEVPANVLAAARAAVPGIVFEEAERETEDGRIVYELEGEANGKEYEIEVSADGTVLEVEEEDDEDEDEDDE